ncbi:MAG TPA: hypothetical protein VMZ73_07070, partial [Acidimicrobiales bacterium]|nr:hypothetical protein [Acidimicrobiales bacterium]
MSNLTATATEIDMSIHKTSGRRIPAHDAGRTGGRRQAMLLCALALPFLIGMYALVLGYWARPASAGQELRM